MKDLVRVSAFVNKFFVSSVDLTNDYLRDLYKLLQKALYKSVSEKHQVISYCCEIYVSAYETEELAAQKLFEVIPGSDEILEKYAMDFINHEEKPPKAPATMLTAWVRKNTALTSSQQKQYYTLAQAFGCDHATYFLYQIEDPEISENSPWLHRLEGVGCHEPRALTALGVFYYTLYRSNYLLSQARGYYDQAIEWFGIAVTQYKEPKACYLLGILRYSDLLSSLGANEVKRKIISDCGRYWKLAADRGHAEAMFMYGYACILKTGEINDTNKSYMLKAKALGCLNAGKWLESETLKPEEFAVIYMKRSLH